MKYRISSPGKVILHGEHSVVYGKQALAGVVDFRTQLDLTTHSNSEIAVFHLQNLNCSFEIQLSEINDFLHNFKKHDMNGTILDNIDDFQTEVRNGIFEKVNRSYGSNSQQVNAIFTIYYLLCGCFMDCPTVEKKEISSGFEIFIYSNMKIGAGLGSSASYGVTLATAFLLLSKQINIESYKNEKSLSLISRWAYQSERIMHGNPSGLDNTVCTYGGIVCFTKGKSFSHIKLEKPFSILVVDTRVERSTKNMVTKVSELKQTFPKLVDCIWSAMEEVVNEVKTVYEEIGKICPSNYFDAFQKMQRLYQINNDLLKAIGVSHPNLEKVFSTATRHGFYSKITGAGGGGYVIIPLRDDYAEKETFKLLLKELQEGGFGAQETVVGGSGVEIIKIE